MPGLNSRLRTLEAKGQPIRVAMTGAGWMGSGFVAAISIMPGMEVAVVVDDDMSAAREAFVAAGYATESVMVAQSVGQATDALRAGKRLVTGSQDLASQIEAVDIVVDVTPNPAIGARTAFSAIRHGKDVVMVNIEADVTVGRVLRHLAEKRGVMYTVSSGDEPGCIKELYDFVDALGYEVIAVGKGKNNPLNRAATPDTVAEAATRQNKEPSQVASYVDGTKTMFEMCCISNALGLPPDIRGMHGPEADTESITKLFALRQDGGVLFQTGVVDYVTGPAMSGGVWVIVRVPDERLVADLRYLKAGSGPHFCFFRPYHLWFLEAGLSVARAHLFGEPTLYPRSEPTSEVLTIAKRDVATGEALDGIGGYTYYGLIDTADNARMRDVLPVGLAEGSRIKQDVKQGEVITYNDVILDESSLLVRLRRQQDGLDPKGL